MQGMYLCTYLFIWMDDSCFEWNNSNSAKIYPGDFHFQEDGVAVLFQLQKRKQKTTLGITGNTNMKILVDKNRSEQLRTSGSSEQTTWWVPWISFFKAYHPRMNTGEADNLQMTMGTTKGPTNALSLNQRTRKGWPSKTESFLNATNLPQKKLWLHPHPCQQRPSGKLRLLDCFLILPSAVLAIDESHSDTHSYSWPCFLGPPQITQSETSLFLHSFFWDTSQFSHWACSTYK